MTPRNNSNNDIRHNRPLEANRHRSAEASRGGDLRLAEASRVGGHRLAESSSVDNQNVKKEITAGVIVYRRTSEGLKFLLLYHRGQYWNFPKGHVEREERSLDAAIRETHEETGLKRTDLRIISGFKEYERFYFKKGRETIFKVVIVYLAETRESRIRISYEHQGYAWFNYREARQITARYKENQKILERAYRFITERAK
ncbi:MAG: NUDIX domain-containing protein [bacterium]|nr:NUDIX domain-containing protein [bacterium]